MMSIMFLQESQRRSWFPDGIARVETYLRRTAIETAHNQVDKTQHILKSAKGAINIASSVLEMDLGSKYNQYWMAIYHIRKKVY